VKTSAEDWCDLAVTAYAAMIEDRMHFAQAAYRDGEWYCILGHSGGNINGEKYDPALGEMLRRTLLEPVGQWCVFWWDHPTMGKAAKRGALRWLAEHKPKVRWIPDRPIGRANQEGRARPFWAACRTRRVVLVGPRHMENLTLFDVADHIVVPEATAWQHIDRICDEVRAALDGKDELVLFAAGMASNVMIHRLWPECRGKATLYDIGAALDPYCGVPSRGSFRENRWMENVMPRNVP
jgi:hypothetical protein